LATTVIVLCVLALGHDLDHLRPRRQRPYLLIQPSSSNKRHRQRTWQVAFLWYLSGQFSALAFVWVRHCTLDYHHTAVSHLKTEVQSVDQSLSIYCSSLYDINSDLSNQRVSKNKAVNFMI
jgi:hypothetical protein